MSTKLTWSRTGPPWLCGGFPPPGKGNPLAKETHELLAAGAAGPGVEFVGNVEGRDVMSEAADVIVTDGFTGNVVLKTLEGAMKFAFGAVLGAVTSDAVPKAAGDAVLGQLMPLAGEMDPETYGGALLLGVDGVCIISHGSSSARAIVNAVDVARRAVADDLVGQLRAAVSAGAPAGADHR